MTKRQIKLSKTEIKLLLEEDVDSLKSMPQFIVQRVLEAESTERR